MLTLVENWVSKTPTVRASEGMMRRFGEVAANGAEFADGALGVVAPRPTIALKLPERLSMTVARATTLPEPDVTVTPAQPPESVWPGAAAFTPRSIWIFPYGGRSR